MEKFSENQDMMSYEEKRVMTRKKKFNQLFEFCIYVLLIMVVCYFVIHFIGQRTYVNGDSMYPNLHDGDQLIVEKVSYRFGEPKRFDIVVFPVKDGLTGKEVNYIKRIIGLPGETVQIKDGKIYIDGEELEEDYGYYEEDIAMLGYDFSEPQEIEPGEYFVLGDNRNDSLDSRKIGCIYKGDIIGKAVWRIYPFSDVGFVN